MTSNHKTDQSIALKMKSGSKFMVLNLVSSGILLLSAIVHFLSDINESLIHESIAFLEVHHGVIVYALFKVLADLSGVFENMKSLNLENEG